MAVLWNMYGDLEPVNTVEWQTTDGPITKIDKYGPPAYPSNLQECSTLEARSLRIRARLNGDFGSAYVGHATRPCDSDTFDDFLEIACEKTSSETIGRSNLAGEPLVVLYQGGRGDLLSRRRRAGVRRSREQVKDHRRFTEISS